MSEAASDLNSLARFSARFGFRVERATRGLVGEALRARVLEGVSGDRLREEVALILSEGEAARALGRMAALGLLEAVLPGVKPDRKNGRLLAQASRVVSLVEKGAQWDPVTVKLLLLLRNASAEALAATAARLAVKGGRAAVLARAGELATIVGRTEKSRTLSDVHAVLEEEPFEVALAVLVLVRSERLRRRIVEYLRRGRGAKPDLSGDDLKEMGFPEGPVLRRILDELLRAKLDGKVSGSRAARAFVRKRFPRPD